MFVDINGKTRIKICLSDSDSDISVRDCVHEGFDFAAFTQKGYYFPEGEGTLSCVECKIGNPESTDGEYTIIGLGMTSDPSVPTDWENMIKTSSGKATEAIRLIHQKNGYAILAHVSTHKNTLEQITRLEGLDAIEVSNPKHGECGEAVKLCDALVKADRPIGIIAIGDEFLGGICVEAKEADSQSIIRAMKAGRFYSSEGDCEVHISELPSGRVQVSCSPASKIEFFTDLDTENTESNRCFEGESLVFAEYVPLDGERFVRAEITDNDGNKAFTNYIEV